MAFILNQQCLALQKKGFVAPPRNYSFPQSKLQLLEVLGSGNFGQVYRAIADGILVEGIKVEVAVKILKSEQIMI